MKESDQLAIAKFLPVLIILWCVIMFGALANGWFNFLTYSTSTMELRGIDFFAVPKSFINLTEGRSAFDTWGGEQWGPYATWYLAHPAFSVFVASWFSFFDPWTSYWLFAIFSLILFLVSAFIISQEAETPLLKALPFFFLTCSMLTFAVLFTGNMHAPVVLSLTLILTGLYKLTKDIDHEKRKANNYLLSGLLISFFSKPVVILYMPLLLINKTTRKTGLYSLGIYAVISFLFLIVPALNPESIGIERTIELALNPEFVKENLNIYNNQFVLNEYMKDNSIHWLNLIAQSDFYWNHVDIFSLSAFVNTLIGKNLPGIIYKIPYLICLIFSLMVFLIKDSVQRMKFTLTVLIAITLTFFLGYNTVWEYQYALILPILAFTPIMFRNNLLSKTEFYLLMISGVCFLFPNLFFLTPQGVKPTHAAIEIIRADRVIPAVIFYLVFLINSFRRLRQAMNS